MGNREVISSPVGLVPTTRYALLILPSFIDAFELARGSIQAPIPRHYARLGEIYSPKPPLVKANDGRLSVSRLTS
jgi:hypothetical protein